jgi:mitogen-activated protein kinase 7
MLGKPLFKGKDYVDQLNKVLDVLGTPDESVIKRIGSDKAQAYVRSLPIKKTIPFRKLLPTADHQVLDLLTKMLTFDPAARITVPQALEHPWLASYHDVNDEPECPAKFEKWRQIEELETLEEFREALWSEIDEFRREVRGINLDLSGLPIYGGSPSQPTKVQNETEVTTAEEVQVEAKMKMEEPSEAVTKDDEKETSPVLPAPSHLRPRPTTSTDPLVTYARRSSIMQPSHQGSTYNSPRIPYQHLPYMDGPVMTAEPGSIPAGSIAFPTQGYVLPARSRTASTAGGEVTRKLLRTLSTVSIHESAVGLEGGLAGIAPIGKYIVERQTEADAPPSEMPREFGIDEASEGEEDSGHGQRNKDKHEVVDVKEKRETRFKVG